MGDTDAVPGIASFLPPPLVNPIQPTRPNKRRPSRSDSPQPSTSQNPPSTSQNVSPKDTSSYAVKSANGIKRARLSPSAPSASTSHPIPTPGNSQQNLPVKHGHAPSREDVTMIVDADAEGPLEETYRIVYDEKEKIYRIHIFATDANESHWPSKQDGPLENITRPKQKKYEMWLKKIGESVAKLLELDMNRKKYALAALPPGRRIPLEFDLTPTYTVAPM
ncbi:hypothetical protein BT69DRAFT_87644 [Atractiella rhizophila]|nr:hypothetical protein BT69DRAFT_87644 [Atractiella rhizophila]